MPLYSYQVMDKAGALGEGKLEAESQAVAVARLEKVGYTALEVNEIKQSSWQRLFEKKRSVSIGELSMFSRQLSAMLDTGIPLTQCLFALGEQMTNTYFSQTLLGISRSVESGASLSQSLEAYPEIFNALYIDMVKAGEVGGALEEVLERLAVQLDSEKKLRDNLRAATFYPLVVVSFSFLIMLVMLVFIVPIFSGFFPPGVDLPLPTRLVLMISDLVRGFWYLLFIFLYLVVVAARHYIKSDSGKNLWEKTKLRLPVFGELIRKTAVTRFVRTLATLLSGGIPVIQALESAGPSSGSDIVAAIAKNTAVRIQEGQNISSSIKDNNVFPFMVSLMISVGEETGDLPLMLNRVADFYEAEVETMTRGLSSLLEPFMLIFVGVIVAALVISLYLPIFTVLTQIV